MRSLVHSLQASGRSARFARQRSLTGVLGLGVMLASACHGGTPPVGATGAGCAKTVAIPSVDAPIGLLNAATFDSAWTIIARSHWDSTYNGVNWRAVRDTLRPKALKAGNPQELRSVLTQMLGTLGQSHFSIIPWELVDEPGPNQRDQSGDIGATIRDVDGSILVTAVRSGGAADNAGIRPGTKIQAIDGCVVANREKAIGVPLEQRKAKLAHWSTATRLLRGPVGDTVRISAKNGAGATVVYAVQRERIGGMVTKVGNLPALSAQLETERRTVAGKHIGVIRFNIWMPVLSEGIRASVDSLRHSDGIVLDLRGNVGGIGMMATGVAGHFVDSALTLGTMIQQGGNQRYIINPQRVNIQNQRVVPFAGPLAIVVDELSISTTEIFAGGLQALNRARIFGSQTAGEALPSVAERLPNGDVLYHAIANFLSPSGKPVEGVGVIPDVAVPITRSQLLKNRDPALDAALNWAASAGSVPASHR